MYITQMTWLVYEHKIKRAYQVQQIRRDTENKYNEFALI